jgi:DNA-directed RNA polymerase subunit RPC12/RpoP
MCSACGAHFEVVCVEAELGEELVVVEVACPRCGARGDLLAREVGR